MEILRGSTIAKVATETPATIKVFQQHGIDFCCGGQRPIAEACAEHGLDVDAFLGELRAVTTSAEQRGSWERAPLPDLIAHIQQRFHEPLRQELPRLGGMLAKVISRHGDRHSETLFPLERAFQRLVRGLLDHMAKEDAILFPAIANLERGAAGQFGGWIDQPIAVMTSEHDDAGRELAEMRRLTSGYAPPAGACATFRGLYFGLAELERDLHEHVHLENNVLFPRAVSLTRPR